MAIEQKHWKRREAANQLHEDGVLPADLGPLHDRLNGLRKSVFYDGEEPDLEGDSIEDVLGEIEVAVDRAWDEAR